MNLYFLVEGDVTERALYPKLIDYFFEEKLTQIRQVHQAVENNYFLLTGGGDSSIFTQVLKNAIEDINDIRAYNYLIFCIDAEENTITERRAELNEYITKYQKEGIVLPKNCQLELIVQNRCIETWFLGNKKVYKNNPSNPQLAAYQKFYNVALKDPELMPIFPNFDNHARFHVAYLKAMLAETNMRYSKKYVKDISEINYLEQLVQRGKQDQHIKSFMAFVHLCEKIKQEMRYKSWEYS